MRFQILMAMCLGLISTVPAFGQSTGRVQDVVICKSPSKTSEATSGKPASNAGRAVRTLRVYETKEKTESGASVDGCRATYSKTNVEQTVGTSRGTQHCQSILAGIKKNLEASNWSCRNAGSMAVLKSSAAESNEALAPANAPAEVKSVVQ